MAFEFRYSIELFINHPTIDPKLISERIETVKPTIETRAGDELVDSRGVARGRRARTSVWCARLHDAETVYSETRPISECIEESLKDLTHLADFLQNLKPEAYVVLKVNWFSETGHSAACLESAAIAVCAELGLGIELNFYGPREGNCS